MVLHKSNSIVKWDFFENTPLKILPDIRCQKSSRSNHWTKSSQCFLACSFTEKGIVGTNLLSNQLTLSLNYVDLVNPLAQPHQLKVFPGIVLPRTVGFSAGTSSLTSFLGGVLERSNYDDPFSDAE